MTNIFKGLKTLAALGLIVCLFLPLSQCTSPANAKLKKEQVVYEHYVVMHKDIGIKGYLPAVVFVLPLLIVLLNIKIPRERLRYELLEFLTGLSVLGIVIFHMKTAKLLVGGYVAMVAVSIYLLITVAESWSTIRYRYNSRIIDASRPVTSKKAE